MKTQISQGQAEVEGIAEDVRKLLEETQSLQSAVEQEEKTKEEAIAHADELALKAANAREYYQKVKNDSDEVHESHASLQSRLRSLQALQCSLQSSTVLATERSECLGQRVTQLTLEKSSIQSNLAALEQLFQPSFKVPRAVPQVAKVAVMSQAVEPMADVCASCSGPLFGKTCLCASCCQPMHWHCVTNRDRLCLPCFSAL